MLCFSNFQQPIQEKIWTCEPPNPIPEALVSVTLSSWVPVWKLTLARAAKRSFRPIGRQHLVIEGKFQPEWSFKVSSVSLRCPHRTATAPEIQSQTRSSPLHCLFGGWNALQAWKHGLVRVKCIIKLTYQKVTIASSVCCRLIQVLKQGRGKQEIQHQQRRGCGEKSVERHTFGFKAPISDPRALRLGLDYCRLDLLLWLFATTSSLGPLPLDQWGYLLRLFQGDFHSRQGIKQTADSRVLMIACLFTLCHAQMSHTISANR